MEEFCIKGEADFIKIVFLEVYGFPESTCHWGGYEVRISVKIHSGEFQVKSTLYTSTGELHSFYEQLNECNKRLSGTANYESCEGNLRFSISYDQLGHTIIKGFFSNLNMLHNELNFEFLSDQTFMIYTVAELRAIVDKYGDSEGNNVSTDK